ncbi:MAG: hypothetical protein JWQ74_1372 [Marmoricola sp.]|nr:hypothetical protein [Marmoricola sp.]
MARLTKKKYLVAGTVVAVLATAGTAFAYFTASGVGTGNGSVAAASDLTVTVGSAPTNLAPGSGGSPMTVTIKNEASFDQQYSTILAEVTGTSAGTACGPENFKFTPYATLYPGAVPVVLTPGQIVTTSVSPRMPYSTVNQDACKGATIYVKVSVS